ncbi:MAG TPA: phosphoribosylglycinamide formyltransferase [Polyangiales bacterium]|nr:phosphoribosylglycinamide formyltransferase [Polyangiales bacterium]
MLESRPPTSIAVLVSGRGSNLRALLAAIDSGRCHARVIAVISDRPAAAALELARERGIPSHVVSPKQHADRPSWDAALAVQVAAVEPELVVMAGFMRLIGTPLLERFGGKIINVHPSLLPAFPGIDAPEQAIAARVRISGCTVHLVDSGVDTGTVLAQAAVPVQQDDDAAALHLRIQAAEHALLPAVVHAIATGAIELGERPRYRGPARDDAALISPPLL